MKTLRLTTREREELVDVTAAVRQAVRANGWTTGAVLLYCPHTTGAVTVNEGADPDVARDIVKAMKKLVPMRGDYAHAEGNSDAHVKSSLFGCAQLVPVEDGEVQLGTWQHIFFCEFDGPRERSLYLAWLPGV